MQRTALTNQNSPQAQSASTSKHAESALSVAVVYQDPLTKHWAAELWDRVGRLLSDGIVCRRNWNLSDLTDPGVFLDAVLAAAEADVLVVSVRDTGELPIGLQVWIDAWMPSRRGRAGALVALIAVPPEPDAQSGHAHAYLKTIALRAGLDFLPRERKLPETRFALSSPAKLAQTATGTLPPTPGSFSHSPRAHSH